MSTHTEPTDRQRIVIARHLLREVVEVLSPVKAYHVVGTRTIIQYARAALVGQMQGDVPESRTLGGIFPNKEE